MHQREEFSLFLMGYELIHHRVTLSLTEFYQIEIKRIELRDTLCYSVVKTHYCTDLSQMPISSQDRISLLLACLFYLFKADIVADSVQISFCKFLVKGERFKAC